MTPKGVSLYRGRMITPSIKPGAQIMAEVNRAEQAKTVQIINKGLL
jgi:hypothetical protein